MTAAIVCGPTPTPTPARGLGPLMVALGRAGVEVAVHPADPSRLRFRSAGPVPPDLLDGLKRHKGAVLALLASGYTPDPHGDTDAGYILSERLGVADGLGLATHPGSAAWLAAVGESMDGA